MNQIFRTLAIVGPATLLAAGTAVASSIVLPAGDLRISFTPAYDSATTGYGNTSCGSAGAGIAGGKECDAVAPNPSVNPTPGALLLGSSPNQVMEDTWGIGKVSVLTNNGNVFYAYGNNGEYLDFIFGGLYDHWVDSTGTISTATFSSGGSVQVWSHGTQGFTTTPSPQDRTGLMTYPGITTGELLLAADFAPGCDLLDPTATLCGTFSKTGFGGGSTAFFNVTGGTWAPYLDTNSLFGLYDFEAEFGFRCAQAGNGCDPANAVNTVLFSLKVDGSADGVVVPVPAPLLLLVPGLFALGAARRRRRLGV